MVELATVMRLSFMVRFGQRHTLPGGRRQMTNRARRAGPQVWGCALVRRNIECSSRPLIGIAAGAVAALLLAMPAGGEPDLRLAREDYPVVDGSTSTQPLGTLVAGRVTRTSVEWRRASIFDPTRG